MWKSFHSQGHTHFSASSLKYFDLFSVLFLLISLMMQSTSCLPAAHLFIYGGCSQAKFQPNSAFQANLNNFFSSLAGSSSQYAYNSFAIGNSTSSPPDSAVYGVYQCRGDLNLPECNQCVANAVGQLGLICVDGCAAQLQLDGCFVRYGDADFLGRLDTSLVFKKCSAGSSKDGVFLRQRDVVLAYLQSGVGFRVKTLGIVEGIAQCLGDLSAGDCLSCLADAVGKLKNICESAWAADVYLAECYARYWASGYYGSTDSLNKDRVGKTVAIIVGVLAGVALFIVLLSYLRKSLE